MGREGTPDDNMLMFRIPLIAVATPCRCDVLLSMSSLRRTAAARPETLYDHFGVSRMASFEEIKDAKHKYLAALEQVEDPELSPEEKYQYMNFTMTKE